MIWSFAHFAHILVGILRWWSICSLISIKDSSKRQIKLKLYCILHRVSFGKWMCAKVFVYGAQIIASTLPIWMDLHSKPMQTIHVDLIHLYICVNYHTGQIARNSRAVTEKRAPNVECTFSKMLVLNNSFSVL